MLNRILSNDLPRSRWLAVLLAVLVLGLAFTPFLFPGVKALNVAAKVLVFIVLVASFDLLLGYTGIVSFAHTMFFGIGAYGIAIASTRLGATWQALGMGAAAALLLSLLLAWLIGLFSLRVRAIFFAMITLAVASAFLTLASQLHEFTGGEDGLSFKVPAILTPSHAFSDEPFLGVLLDGRLLSYYLLFAMATLLFLALLRIVNSPFGRVLQAIRENEFRAEAIGYRVVLYRTISSILSALFACAAGAMLVLNDSAPQLADAAIERIRAYAGQPPAFATVRELEAFFRQVYAPYGWLSDAQWRRLTETSVRRLADGRVTPHYDPALVQQFIAHPNDYLIWDHFDAVPVPVLCLRGAHSDLVLPDTLAQMRSRGPGAAGRLSVVEVPDCGHAPALNVPAQLLCVGEFLARCEAAEPSGP